MIDREVDDVVVNYEQPHTQEFGKPFLTKQVGPILRQCPPIDNKVCQTDYTNRRYRWLKYQREYKRVDGCVNGSRQ